MIRAWLANRLLDWLCYSPIARGKYRLAQAASLLGLDGIPVRTIYGPKLLTRFQDSTFWLAARKGNEGVIGLLSDLSSKDVFIDVGANQGLTTAFSSQFCSAVIALEPSPREFEWLLRNSLLTDPGGRWPVLLLSAAAEKQGYTSFRVGHISHSGGNSIGFPESGEEIGITVATVALDDLFKPDSLDSFQELKQAWDSCHLVVKIDVEGYESSVLRGMESLLSQRRCRKVIVEVDPRRAQMLGIDFDVDSFMSSYGYEPTIEKAKSEHFDQCYVPAVL